MIAARSMKETAICFPFCSMFMPIIKGFSLPLCCLLLFFGESGVFARGIGDQHSMSPTGNSGIENMLFCNVTGYTNSRKEGEPEELRKRAVEAAKYMVKKKAKVLILGEQQLLEGFEFHRDSVGEIFQYSEEGVKEVQNASEKLYGIQLSGVISYSFPPSEFTPKGSSPPLSVTLSSRKGRYKQGEALTLTIKGNRDFYGCLLNVTPDGQVLQLLPNSNRKFARFKGGVDHEFPDPFRGDSFKLEVNPPYGQETIYLLASDQAFSGLPGADTSQVFSSTTESIGVIKQGIKNLLLQDIMAQADVGSFYCRYLVIRQIVVETEGA